MLVVEKHHYEYENHQTGETMKLYEETVRCDVRLPTDANEIVESEARRTGIQKAVLLRHVILEWTNKIGRIPAAGGERPGTTPDRGAHRTHGAGADD